jgi:hypothetical protein
MSRSGRAVHLGLLAEPADFNEQMFHALRAAPWWMISISFHVLVVVVSSLFTSDAPLRAAGGLTATVLSAADEAPPEPEKTEEDDVEVETLRPDEFRATEPVISDAPISDHNETDNDMPTEEPMGEGGSSDGPFDGLANNPYVGLGGGSAGGPLGLGGHRNLRKGSGQNTKIRQETQDAVEDALRWLAAHQSPDGSWQADGWRGWCDRKPVSDGDSLEGAGRAQYDVGVSGLALLAFLGAGYTNRSEGPFGKVVGDGLKFLRSVQDAEGCFGSRGTTHYVYNHAISALAMVEAYGMTGSSIYRGPAQKGLDFIAIARNPYFAWRYGVKPGDNDTSVMGWMMMALKSAKLINAADVQAGKAASLTFDEEAFDGIRAWVDKMTDPDTGRAGYQIRGTGPARPEALTDRFPAEKSESMTAAALLARIFLGENPKGSDPIRKGADLCAKLLPRWDAQDGSIDMYYWYYATLAMFQVGGEPWKKWEAAMKPAIVDTQRRDGDFCRYKGSWDPIDPWGVDGGRVYSTACLAMCLEVWYRYPRVAGTGGGR